MTVLEQRFMELACSFFKKMMHKEIDWEQRRYEIVKETAVALNTAQWYEGSYQDAAKAGVILANAIIAELKKQEDEK